MKGFPARLPAALHDRLRDAAHERHTSMNAVLVAALERELGPPGYAAEQAPAWALGIVAEEIRQGERLLMDTMLATGEDITDVPLWRLRRRQFLSLLADQAARRW